ncbi:TetR/AcrR family transcriptional regulator [Brevundimonas lenta]|uniref:AcrR family transcriptional regulator n=1 Tax=Brevundimonas lenta TaxID=424796 RepID=A0A7W6JH59_9CAUL|nr:TetR/AcrR family transcriptional regulator [Brevundimonas lenta]MBB4084088.1 AcrR family transcriptional regulator [Brevundimonas lenta]
MFCHVAPRPRNAEATRAAILTAARERFARESYDDVGMRDIAGDVGVDAALVSRYFGSKEDLFVSVLDSCDNGGELMAGDRGDFGRRIAHEVIYEGKSESKLKGLLILLRSIGSTKAMELVQRTGNERFFNPFAAWVGGPDGAVRARLAAAFIMGMTVSREITGGFGLSPRECEEMERRMAVILQDVIDA